MFRVYKPVFIKLNMDDVYLVTRNPRFHENLYTI